MAPLSRPPSAVRRVLFIDDDPEIRKLYARMARRHHFAADTAGGPVEALAMARNRRYDVVVSDFNMPNLDGKAVLEHVGRELPKAVLMVVTGIKPLPAVNLRSGRPVAVIAKPFEDRELAARIRRALDLNDDATADPTERRIADEAEAVRLARLKAVTTRRTG